VRFGIEYYNARVLSEVESWPSGVLADYARLVELLIEHGPRLKLPHSRGLGEGLFELRPHGREGIARAMCCFSAERRATVVHAFIKKKQEHRPRT
jgi:phage-related protein